MKYRNWKNRMVIARWLWAIIVNLLLNRSKKMGITAIYGKSREPRRTTVLNDGIGVSTWRAVIHDEPVDGMGTQSSDKSHLKSDMNVDIAWNSWDIYTTYYINDYVCEFTRLNIGEYRWKMWLSNIQPCAYLGLLVIGLDLLKSGQSWAVNNFASQVEQHMEMGQDQMTQQLGCYTQHTAFLLFSGRSTHTPVGPKWFVCDNLCWNSCWCARSCNTKFSWLGGHLDHPT